VFHEGQMYSTWTTHQSQSYPRETILRVHLDPR
jgi:hypothetical protein